MWFERAHVVRREQNTEGKRLFYFYFYNAGAWGWGWGWGFALSAPPRAGACAVRVSEKRKPKSARRYISSILKFQGPGLAFAYRKRLRAAALGRALKSDKK